MVIKMRTLSEKCGPGGEVVKAILNQLANRHGCGSFFCGQCFGSVSDLQPSHPDEALGLLQVVTASP